MQRFLARRYAERDVADVETYVREVVRGMAPASEAEADELVARGIFLVRRIAVALPPEASLEETLRERLAVGLNALREEAGPPGTDPTGAPTRRAA